jgi:hypothetical protein
LIDVINLGARADLHHAAGWFQLLEHDLEERRFPQAVPSDDAKPFSGREIQ